MKTKKTISPFESQLKQQMMTVRECAEYLRIHELTVYRLCKGNIIPNYRFFGRLRIPKNKLDIWIEGKCILKCFY